MVSVKPPLGADIRHRRDKNSSLEFSILLALAVTIAISFCIGSLAYLDARTVRLECAQHLAPKPIFTFTNDKCPQGTSPDASS